MHTMESYSVFQKYILPLVTAEINLEDTTLSKTARNRRVNIIRYELYEVSEIVRLVEADHRMVVARA